MVNERVRQCRIQGEPADANIYEEWDAYLSKLGAGEEGIGVTSCDDTQHDAAKLIKLPSDIVFQGQDLDAFIDEFYPDIVANYTNVDWLKARTILAPKTMMSKKSTPRSCANCLAPKCPSSARTIQSTTHQAYGPQTSSTLGMQTACLRTSSNSRRVASSCSCAICMRHVGYATARGCASK